MDNFWSKIEWSEDCWTWIGRLSNAGYGIYNNGKKDVFAHRFSYELFVGEIPVGLQIDHLCFNRACINPDHLEPVTGAVNVQRAKAYKQKIFGNTIKYITRNKRQFCLNGHKFTPENTIWLHVGGRVCATCYAKNNVH